MEQKNLSITETTYITASCITHFDFGPELVIILGLLTLLKQCMHYLLQEGP